MICTKEQCELYDLRLIIAGYTARSAVAIFYHFPNAHIIRWQTDGQKDRETRGGAAAGKKKQLQQKL